jgi:hypothetical protein
VNADCHTEQNGDFDGAGRREQDIFPETRLPSGLEVADGLAHDSGFPAGFFELSSHLGPNYV